VARGVRRERIDAYYCLGDVVGYGGSPNECADLVREVAKVTILGNHDAAVAGRMDYSYYYEAARQALDLHARHALAREHRVAAGAAVQARPRRGRRHLCHGSPVRLEEFEYIFAPEQARECLPIWDELGTSRSSGTRTSARCSRSRPPRSKSCRPDFTSSPTRSTS
jgi:hypothetical protein